MSSGSLKRIGFLFCSLVLMHFVGLGQENIVKCHTYEMQDKFFEEHPHLKSEAENLAHQILERARLLNKQGVPKDGDPYIIPVVFHVVHQFGPENISFNQIEDAIRVMNDDFNANSFGINTVNDAFVDIIGDIGIEFRLAKIDPDGNCTNGVVRTVSEVTNFGGENLKEVSPIWDRSKYMNIWVCKTIESGAAGYTYYPSSLAGAFGETNDGIVVRYDYVGSIEESNVGRSQTLTHEVGHWIDLPHLWGSTNQPDLESNCDTDDGVDDTPNTIGWTTCNTYGQSCGSLDNVQNFMEYSFCGRMFTEGQKIRMLAALTSSIAERNNLWSQDNLEATGVLQEGELCDADFTVSKRVVCRGEEVTFNDVSYSGIANRTWIFEGGFPATSSAENPTVTYSEPGLFSVSLAVSDSFGAQLTEVSTDFIQVLDTGLLSLPYEESFTGYNSFSEIEDEAWFTKNIYGEDTWEISSQVGASDNYSATFRAFEAEDETIIGSSFVSQTFQLSDVGANPVFTFKHAAARSSTQSSGELWVFISRNCGELWSLRKVYDDGDMYTTEEMYPNGYEPASDEWVTTEINTVVSLFQNEKFRLKFEYRGSSGGTVYIDDINLVEPAVLSTSETIGDSGLKVFPNPTTGHVTLQLQKGFVEQISVRDMSGRIVYSRSVKDRQGSTVEVDLSHLSSGFYLLESGGKGRPITKKIIIE
jgi:PKD repeat protein